MKSLTVWKRIARVVVIATGLASGAFAWSDDVRIWNVARTQEEILADMIRPLDGDEAGLVAYWAFDDPEVATTGIVADRSANGYDGTVHGATWSGESLGGYTVYHTSGVPSRDGLDAFTVEDPGVQELVVSAQYPLILFDLTVSLEWDAREDTLFLDQLESDVRRASELLYDWTNGQAALGRVTVYHDKKYWQDAHVQGPPKTYPPSPLPHSTTHEAASFAFRWSQEQTFSEDPRFSEQSNRTSGVSEFLCPCLVSRRCLVLLRLRCRAALSFPES